MKSVLIFTLVTLLPVGLLAQWDPCAIGGGSQIGIDHRGANAFDVTSFGYPLGGATDSIAFVSGSAKLEGNCDIIVHVTRLRDGTEEWAEGGLMLRETLGSDSKFVALACTKAHGLHTYVRRQAATALTNQDDGGYQLPFWLKLVRRENHILGYKSDDGEIWIQTDDITIQMKKYVWVGVFVTSGAGPTVVISFDHVAIHAAAGAAAQ